MTTWAAHNYPFFHRPLLAYCNFGKTLNWLAIRLPVAQIGPPTSSRFRCLSPVSKHAATPLVLRSSVKYIVMSLAKNDIYKIVLLINFKQAFLFLGCSR